MHQSAIVSTRLGLRHAQRAAWIGLPANLSFLPLTRNFARSEMVIRGRDLSDGPFDMIHIFTMSHAMLDAELPQVRRRLAPDGEIWVSWPAVGTGLPTDVTSANLKPLASEMQLVAGDPDSLDEQWMAMRLTLP